MSEPVCCPDCGDSLALLAVSTLREVRWCDGCGVTKPLELEPSDSGSDDPRELELDPSLSATPVNATPAHIWFGRDDPLRVRLARLRVERDRLIRDPRATFNTQVMPWRRPLMLVERELRAAEKFVTDLLLHGWHAHDLNPFQRQLAICMEEGHENNGRRRAFIQRSSRAHHDGESVLQGLSPRSAQLRELFFHGGTHAVTMPTGNQTGRPPAEPLSEEAEAEVIAWLERELGRPIEEIRACLGRGKLSPLRDALAEAVRGSSTKTADLASVLGCHRNTVTNWRSKATQTPTKGAGVVNKVLGFESDEAAHKLELLRVVRLASGHHTTAAKRRV